MTGEHRARWKAVLRQIKGNAPTKPAASWVKAAESRLASLGIEEFRGRMRDWLAPLRAAEPSPLSVAGSHVLRGLLWYAALARDPAIGEAALWVVDAAWKPKRRAEKVVVALVPLLEGMPPETAWPPLQQLQRQWPMPGGQIERLLKKVAAGLEIDEAELRHQGLLTPTPETPSVAASMDRLMAAAARLQRRLPD